MLSELLSELPLAGAVELSIELCGGPDVLDPGVELPGVELGGVVESGVALSGVVVVEPGELLEPDGLVEVESGTVPVEEFGC